jgi:hypothetical protein
VGLTKIFRNVFWTDQNKLQQVSLYDVKFENCHSKWTVTGFRFELTMVRLIIMGISQLHA